MEKLPESLYVDYTDRASSSKSTPYRNYSIGATTNTNNAAEVGEIEKLIRLLNIPHTRDQAIKQLATMYKMQKATGPELAFLLWYSQGTIFSLLQELFRAYRFLSPPRLSMADSTRICDVLLLIQCMASHPEVRMEIIKAEILVYLYPLLNTSERLLEVDYLRVSGLGILMSLIKGEEEGPHTGEIVNYLLKSETVPVCVHCMDVGSDLTKSLAAVIVGKILACSDGKMYVATFVERFYLVSRALSKMVDEFTGKPPSLLLKNILICYLRLADIPRCRDALTSCFPMQLRDHAYLDYICDEPTRGLAHQVLNNIMEKQQVEPVPLEDLMAALKY